MLQKYRFEPAVTDMDDMLTYVPRRNTSTNARSGMYGLTRRPTL